MPLLEAAANRCPFRRPQRQCGTPTSSSVQSATPEANRWRSHCDPGHLYDRSSRDHDWTRSSAPLASLLPFRLFVADGGLFYYGTEGSRFTGARPCSWTASCGVQVRPSFRSNIRPSSNWSSTSRPPKRSAYVPPAACHRRRGDRITRNVACICSRPLLALLRHSESVDGLPLSGQQRSLIRAPLAGRGGA